MKNRRSTIALATFFAVATTLVACGGSDDGPSTTLTVTPALGAVYGASVTVFNGTSGATLGTGITGATTGSASIPLVGSTAGPIVVKVSLDPGTKFFDEKSGTDITISSASATTLLTALPSLPASATKSIGVTPLTNMAARLAGLTSSGAVLVTAQQANEGAARTVLALGLPSTFNIMASPIAAKTATFPTDVYGRLLAEMAKLAPTGKNALDQSNVLVSSVSAATSTISVTSSTDLTAVTVAISSAAATVNTLRGAGTIAVTLPNLAPAANALSSAASSQNTANSSGNAPTGASGGAN